ncbi:MAG: enoyl-CoA hydratase/isomerase family protein [Pseudomonadota bacterium]
MELLLIEDKPADGGVVRVLTMNRPDKLNALNHALSQGLHDTLWAAEADDAVAAVILTGAGRAFCAGADISEFSSLVPEDPKAVTTRADLTMNLHLAFGKLSKPVIAAVRGYAMGGGCGLALACDLVIASETAKFGYPEVKRGIVGAVVTPNLIRQVGRKAAFELLALGEPVGAERALALGMVNRVVPDDGLSDAALAVATTVAGMSRDAMAATKRLFHRVADVSLEQGLQAGRDTNVMMRGFRKSAHK